MSIMPMDDFTVAFRKHVEGSDRFTRRMAISLSRMDGTTPRQTVLRCERLGLLRHGSWGWFLANGGITKEHIEEVLYTSHPAGDCRPHRQ